jgi:ABC-type transport system involved in cytochrome bd biosynthesis fused ATPase/permease subunit
MALKKSENAMLNNILRNVLVPITVFYLAKYLSADFNSFFWLWAAFQWTLSLFLLLFVIYFIKYRLNKSSRVI